MQENIIICSNSINLISLVQLTVAHLKKSSTDKLNTKKEKRERKYNEIKTKLLEIDKIL